MTKVPIVIRKELGLLRQNRELTKEKNTINENSATFISFTANYARHESWLAQHPSTHRLPNNNLETTHPLRPVTSSNLPLSTPILFPIPSPPLHNRRQLSTIVKAITLPLLVVRKSSIIRPRGVIVGISGVACFGAKLGGGDRMVEEG